MGERHQTQELREAQRRRETEEDQLAKGTIDETETAQHERRADKARYLRQKLEQRAASERES